MVGFTPAHVNSLTGSNWKCREYQARYPRNEKQVWYKTNIFISSFSMVASVALCVAVITFLYQIWRCWSWQEMRFVFLSLVNKTFLYFSLSPRFSCGLSGWRGIVVFLSVLLLIYCNDCKNISFLFSLFKVLPHLKGKQRFVVFICFFCFSFWLCDEGLFSW